jgi:5-(carboxyamino)imidazole ribonucleotide synthase
MSRSKKIGILGGGQLARMSAYQAYKLGFDVVILEKELNSPAGQLTKNDFAGWVTDEDSLKKFSDASDIVTLENEFIDYKVLEKIESYGKKVVPGPYTISLIQDKYIQKETLSRHGIPVPEFTKVTGTGDYQSIKKQLGAKFLLKSRKLGYDGYGNYTVKNEEDLSRGVKQLSSRHSELMAESFINFKMELAVMVVRTKHEIKTYPVVETIQKNHICHFVIAPADVGKGLRKKAAEIAAESVKAVEGFGIFGIELFLTGDNKLLVNEMAPRPHNSGHYTIEGCKTSQFENHIRAVLNLPLGSTEMIKRHAVMMNILGKNNTPGVIDNYEQLLKNDELHFHLYGKKESRPGRKMGHLTMTGNDLKKIIKTLKKTEKKILI